MKAVLRTRPWPLLLMLLTACGRDDGATPSAAPSEPAPVVALAPEQPADSSAASPSGSGQAPSSPAMVPDAASATPAGTDGPTGFHGFGPARFGDDAESVRLAWGRPLAFDREREPGDTCAYLQVEPHPDEGAPIAFMIEEGRFVRYDVATPEFVAPGGGRVGQDRQTLAGLYAERHDILPHNYIEGGHYLRVAGPEGSDSALVFELAADGRVTEWRIGLPPPVDYAEGCS